jgi:hypothetical protein
MWEPSRRFPEKMAATHSTRTLQKGHNCLTRAVRHAEGQDLVRRNVSALEDTPRGLERRPSQSLTLEQASALLEAAEASRLHAFIVLPADQIFRPKQPSSSTAGW